MLPALTVLFCVSLRLLPHPPNFAPVGATAVFAGRTLSLRWALLLTLGAMLVADVLLAALRGHALVDGTTPFVYLAFGVQVLLGRWLRARRGGALAAAGVGALAFFALSNLGVFLTSGMYPLTTEGLGACFALALPFLGATLASDLLWTAALSVGYRALAERLAARGTASARWVPTQSAELPAL